MSSSLDKGLLMACNESWVNENNGIAKARRVCVRIEVVCAVDILPLTLDKVGIWRPLTAHILFLPVLHVIHSLMSKIHAATNRHYESASERYLLSITI